MKNVQVIGNWIVGGGWHFAAPSLAFVTVEAVCLVICTRTGPLTFKSNGFLHFAAVFQCSCAIATFVLPMFRPVQQVSAHTSKCSEIDWSAC
jgi:hypothetical protein